MNVEMYEEIRDFAHEMVAEYGQTGFIERKDGVRHAVTFILLDFSPLERQGAMIEYTDKRAFVSALNLTFEPVSGDDVLLVNDVPHSIFDPKPINPAGINVVWEMRVRR